jgi:hypothetical protein
MHHQMDGHPALPATWECAASRGIATGWPGALAGRGQVLSTWEGSSTLPVTWVDKRMALLGLPRLLLPVLFGASFTLKAAMFQLAVVDEASQPLPCRVLARLADGNCAVPAGATVLRIGPDRWFMCSGKAELNVDEGPVELRVERGLEYSRFKVTLPVSGPNTSQQVILKRWINLRELGYLSAENHLHLASDELGPMAIAEGLDFASSLTWWNGPDQRRPVPAGSGKHRVLRFAGHEITASIYDAELEHAWGAAYLLNLPAPLSSQSDKGRPNLEYLKQAVANGAIVHYQGGWSREVLLDALLGYVHTVNVCNNNFHLHRFQPRRRYSNLLGVPEFPLYPETVEGMMQMNIDTYYRLLNCGLRLAAGAGSATGAKEVPVGYNRACVKVRANASLDEFYGAWKAGRNFVSNGPILLFSTAGGQGPGDEIQLPKGGGRLRFKVRAVSDQDLTAVEIVQNGAVVNQLALRNPRLLDEAFDLDVHRGSWIAARCTVRDDWLTDAELGRYANGDQQQPSRLRFAHTSPIYVTVDGQGPIEPKAVQEGLQMLDHLELFGRENAAPFYRPAFAQAINQARGLLRSRL